MSVDPALRSDVFDRYCELRNMPTEKSQITLFRERITSYEARVQHHQRQLSGEIPRKQPEEALERGIDDALTKRLECLEGIKLLNQMSEFHSPVQAALLEREFAQLCGLSKVTDLSLEHNGIIKVVIQARYLLGGTWFDLGDWAVTFGARLMSVGKHPPFLAKEIRCGRFPHASENSPPSYRVNDGNFCFGDNLKVINHHMVAGEFLQGIRLISYGLNSINTEHVHLVPQTFRFAQEQERI